MILFYEIFIIGTKFNHINLLKRRKMTGKENEKTGEDLVYKQTYDIDGKWTRNQIIAKTFKFAIILLIIVCSPRIILNFFFVQMRVVGVSMQPTLNATLKTKQNEAYYEQCEKDTIYVSRIFRGDVGDIVALVYQNKPMVKRYIAKGGQTISLKRDKSSGLYVLYVDDKKLDESYLGENYKDMDANYFAIFCNIASTYNINEASLTVPEGKIFVLGDNRGESNDSHMFGCIDESCLFGRVDFYYSYDSNLIKYVFGLIFG